MGARRRMGRVAHTAAHPWRPDALDPLSSSSRLLRLPHPIGLHSVPESKLLLSLCKYGSFLSGALIRGDVWDINPRPGFHPVCRTLIPIRAHGRHEHGRPHQRPHCTCGHPHLLRGRVCARGSASTRSGWMTTPTPLVLKAAHGACAVLWNASSRCGLYFTTQRLIVE
jgi:hypothetical protein